LTMPAIPDAAGEARIFLTAFLPCAQPDAECWLFRGLFSTLLFFFHAARHDELIDKLR
jgi:hypothetical protein